VAKAREHTTALREVVQRKTLLSLVVALGLYAFVDNVEVEAEAELAAQT
jgi:hypothetical protein